MNPNQVPNDAYQNEVESDQINSTPNLPNSPSLDEVVSPPPDYQASQVINPTVTSSTPSNGPTTAPNVNDIATPPESSPYQTNQDQPTIVNGQILSSQSENLHKSRFKNKRTFIFAGFTILLVILGSTGYVLGFYLPNKPENVWKTGFSRTGEASQKLISGAVQTDKLSALEKSEFSVNLDVEAAGKKYNGTVDGKFDPKKANYSLTYATKSGGETEQKLAAEVISDLPDNKLFPNIYFKVSGISSFGLTDLMPDLGKYEGKWIAVDSDYLASFGGSVVEQEKDKKQPAKEDYAELVNAVTKSVKEYILTGDETKAVVNQQSFVGQEKIDGITAYHYKVTINKDHAKQFCKSVVENIAGTKIGKDYLLNGEASEGDTIKTMTEDCQKSVDEDSTTTDQAFDIWIDKKYKLIHKVRFTEKGKDVYVEFGQQYTGGDEVPLFINYHDGVEDSETKLSVKINMKNSSLDGSFTMNGGKDDGKYSISATMNGKPFSGEIKADKPADAIPFQELFNALGLGYLGTDNALYGDITNTSQNGQSLARDAERQTDINALHGQIEAYYATNGYYPSLDQLNNPAWVKQNLIGLVSDALKDPQGSDSKLSGSATEYHYVYKATGCTDGGNQCTSYTLSATLESGQMYSKSALN